MCRSKLNRFLRNKQLDGKYNTSTIDDMPRKCLVLDFFGGIGVIPPIPTSVTVHMAGLSVLQLLVPSHYLIYLQPTVKIW